MYQGKLLTKAYRVKWASHEDASCPLCGEGEETTEHLMIECLVSKRIWLRIMVAIELPVICSSMEELWQVDKSLCTHWDKSARAKISQILNPAVTWAIWLARNHLVFRDTPVYEENIWESVENFVKVWGLSCIGVKRVAFIRERLYVKE
ncbi:hypothetical protein QJS04_geneDACA014461 [Acorus gramineus]|uniref:Reverse transcriptase zinc-binding domain-containing protein n=1 Tax=Acorus gramineus TaxID=55184 RepID=A0AAV9BQ78_ACOGR|nr:hypothetical protein QJS04_geneDACA014461 [Acorus gramineus]